MFDDLFGQYPLKNGPFDDTELFIEVVINYNDSVFSVTDSIEQSHYLGKISFPESMTIP